MREELCARRRAVLAGLGGIGVAGLLAACGDEEPVPEPVAESAKAEAKAAESAKAGAKAALTETASVPVGGGVVANGLLIVQPVSGSFKAFDAACPHKGVLVTAPENGVATCPAHKSTFNIADGAKIAGPTPSGLKEVAIKVDGAKILRA